MAKELPYFKFEPNQWENGNIQICNREDKGLFIDLCSMYWSRLGDLPIKLAIQKLCNGNATAFDLLMRENIFKVIDGQICIDFLNEQLIEFENLSSTNSENARLGWEKRRKNAVALGSQSDGNAIRGEERKGDKNKEKEILFESLWKDYPTKVGKQDSLRKFLKLSDNDLDKVKSHLPIFSKKKEFDSYSHPHLSTYLNQKRYMDLEVEAKSKVKFVGVRMGMAYIEMREDAFEEGLRKGTLNCDNPIIEKRFER
jgi:hypothetical protein